VIEKREGDERRKRGTGTGTRKKEEEEKEMTHHNSKQRS
jgi:hypothetical protein